MIRKLKIEHYRGFDLHFFVGPQSGLVTGYAKDGGEVVEVVRGTSKVAVMASLKDFIDKHGPYGLDKLYLSDTPGPGGIGMELDDMCKKLFGKPWSKCTPAQRQKADAEVDRIVHEEEMMKYD